MSINIKIAIAATISFIAPVALACDYPKRANLPNGSTASKEDMLAGQRSVKAYMATMEEYLACIDEKKKNTDAELIDSSDEERARREAANNKKYNAAVEEMELTAARFNEEVRAYKAQDK
jgi:hypothetical protein